MPSLPFVSRPSRTSRMMHTVARALPFVAMVAGRRRRSRRTTGLAATVGALGLAAGAAAVNRYLSHSSTSTAAVGG